MISDATIAADHPDLPGLALLLDPARLTERLTGEGRGDYRLDRLRIKPGASVTAMLRPAGGTGPWLLARGLAPEPWETKRHKDLRAAAKAGVPGWEWPESRLVLVAGAADRRIRRLARLRPDTDSGPRTLSHNPARRWVGVAMVEGERRVLRLHHDRPAQSLPWHPGRTWRPGDAVPIGGDGAARFGGAAPYLDLAPAVAVAPVDLVARLDAAVCGMHMVHAPWGERAAAVVARITDPLRGLAYAPAHGDLTPDQVVIDPAGGVTILDWDEAGWWPEGWDAATWTAGLIVAGWHPGDGTAAVETRPAVDPALLAAAAVLRSPEPFRRRHAEWADRTERLLAQAEHAVLARSRS